MLKKNKITKGDWESSGKNINTKSGVFIGYAANPEDAKMLAASKQFLTLLEKFAKENEELESELKALLGAS